MSEIEADFSDYDRMFGPQFVSGEQLDKEWALDEPTYRIKRFCFDESSPEHHKVIETGLTLDEAQEHCQRPDTHGDGWFDGYEEE